MAEPGVMAEFLVYAIIAALHVVIDVARALAETVGEPLADTLDHFARREPTVSRSAGANHLSR